MKDCLNCEYAKRDDRGRYIEPCRGYANCDFSEYKGTVDMTEEEKDKLIKELTDKLEVAEGTKRRLTIFDRISIVTETEQRVAKEILAELEETIWTDIDTSSDIGGSEHNDTIKSLIKFVKEKYQIKENKNGR